ncbi:hypothetical protein HYY75_01430, partial [bacterium]|nr:hypothetical protein [bacterium]
TLGPPKYRANFKQKVTKSVFKRDYYTGSTSLVPGEITLGFNEFFRDFGTATPTDRSTWIWIEPGFNQLSPVVSSEYRTELAIINSATPPEVSNASAVCDISGPLIQDPPDTGPLVTAVPDSEGKFRDDVFYYFEVENAPIFDANGVNFGSSGEDKDGDGRIGLFPTTAEEASLKYYWKILQVKDRYGADVSTVILDQETDGTFSTSSLLPVNLPGGEYRIGVKAKYKFFDYNRMLPGELSDKKNNYLSGLLTAQGEDAAQISWVTFKVKTVVDPVCPGGKGIIMSGKNVSTGYYYRPVSPEDDGTPYCDTSTENPASPKFVIKENTPRWSFQLRESNYNLTRGTNRISSMTAATPPDPLDPRMETGTLNWEGDARFTWSTVLERNGEGIVSKSIDSATYTIFIDSIRTLFPLPSQPATYSFKVDGSRVYSYWTQFPTTRLVGGRIVTDWVRTKIVKYIKITGDSVVYMTDETPPQSTYKNVFGTTDIPAVFFNTDLFYGTTGETLANVDSPPRSNSSTIEMIVADNNPFGNIPGDNFIDPFHSTEATHHNLTNRLASFSYTNKAGPIPLAGDFSMTSYYSNSPGGMVAVADLDESAFKSSWVPGAAGIYNKSCSYRLYRIQRDSLVHFSQDKVTLAWQANMALTYANNSPGYQNLQYGFGWKESCGLATSTNFFGKIMIRDNDRPNTFIKIVEQKHPSTNYFTPSNVKLEKMSYDWERLSTGGSDEANHNGVYPWDSPDILGFDSSCKVDVTEKIKN